ncbi:MAG TPA: VOC family protein [Candidatus Saccharimonadales bacterium]|nr:VOC family protein [Candidatus Saccharimonadales bacterium]
MQKIVTSLWFDNEAEEAANFYIALFPNSRITNIMYYPEAATGPSGKPTGSVLTVDFELDGQQYNALNGGPDFQFSEAVSLIINCETQEELDHYWDGLLADGGRESQCGWLKDKFGMSWQVVPTKLDELMRDPNQKKVEAVTAVMMQSVKLNIDELQQAYDNA